MPRFAVAPLGILTSEGKLRLGYIPCASLRVFGNERLTTREILHPIYKTVHIVQVSIHLCIFELKIGLEESKESLGLSHCREDAMLRKVRCAPHAATPYDGSMRSAATLRTTEWHGLLFFQVPVAAAGAAAIVVEGASYVMRHWGLRRWRQRARNLALFLTNKQVVSFLLVNGRITFNVGTGH